jgi:acetoacetyl-CoA reductase
MAVGETISTKMVDAGYKVAVTYSPATRRTPTGGADGPNGYAILAVPCDVADFASCGRAVAEVRRSWAGRRAEQRRHHARHDLQEDGQGQLGRGLRTNLDSLFNMTSRSPTARRAQLGPGHQRLVGQRQKGAFGQTNYSAAKAGVHGFTKALALEVAKRRHRQHDLARLHRHEWSRRPEGVLDSKILPHIPVGRLGKPEEVAGLIIYLASERRPS